MIFQDFDLIRSFFSWGIFWKDETLALNLIFTLNPPIYILATNGRLFYYKNMGKINLSPLSYPCNPRANGLLMKD